MSVVHYLSLAKADIYLDSILTTGALITFASAVAIMHRSDAPSNSPFNDCLDSEKSWSDCRLVTDAHFDMKRDAANSSSPFHDCLEAGGDWSDCRLTAQSTTLDSRSKFNERGVTNKILGTIDDFGLTLGQSEKCYSVNGLGGASWLTNTAVNKLSNKACTFAVNQAITQLTSNQSPLGKYTKTGLSGFYMANGGPVVTSNVKFFLSTLFEGDYTDLPDNIDLREFGIDLCNKGVSHLTDDDGCTAARKAGGKTEHTSVNGGEFNYASSGNGAIFNDAGICTNCLFSMVLEAANKVDKDGTNVSDIES